MPRRFARKPLILQEAAPQTEKIFRFFSLLAGKFADAIAPYSASLPAMRSRVVASAKRKTVSGTRTDT